MSDVELLGCRSLPLLSYLKTLGVFRHVAVADRSVRLWWHAEGHAVLGSHLDGDAIVDFFLDEYAPTPIASPWNNGSGFFASKVESAAALEQLSRSKAPRLAALASTTQRARELLDDMGISRWPDSGKGDLKLAFFELWRACCPSAALDWIDAAIVLSDTGLTMNPLLGTGATDGNLDFGGNFNQRLIECLAHVVGGDITLRASSAQLIRSSLFGQETRVSSTAVGMFAPAFAGAANSSSSAREESLVNPWDFVLLLEGACLFAGGVARRLNADGAVFPFTVRRTGSVGNSLDAEADGSARGETWLPIWGKPATLPAVQRLLAEGRAQDGRRQSSSGRDLIRAATDMGVDRGINRFERIVYAQRFGRTYLAVPTGAVETKGIPVVSVLRSADRWLDRARRSATRSTAHALAIVDRAAAEVATGTGSPEAVERWLLALADAELTVARRPSARAASEPTHVPPLSSLPRGLVFALPTGPEHRLARALAAAGRRGELSSFRELVEPVRRRPDGTFAWTTAEHSPGASLAHPLDLLIAFAQRAWPALAVVTVDERARLDDVAAFLAGRTDDGRIVRLAHAFTLCRPCWQPRRRLGMIGAVDRLYALVRLVTADPVARRPGGEETDVQFSSAAFAALRAGNARNAARAAGRRLRAHGLVPFASLDGLDRPQATTRRIAAALAFPLHPADRVPLERATLTPVDEPSPEEGEL